MDFLIDLPIIYNMPRPYSVLKFKVEEVHEVLERPAEYHEDKDDVFRVIKGKMHFILGPVTTQDGLTWISSAIVGGEEFLVEGGGEVRIPAGNWHSWTAPDSAMYTVEKVPAIEGRIKPQ